MDLTQAAKTEDFGIFWNDETDTNIQHICSFKEFNQIEGKQKIL